jgi:hypothetical protein
MMTPRKSKYNANSVLGCEGLPYALTWFEVEGHWKPGEAALRHEMEIPSEGAVVKFGSEEARP